MTKPLKFTSDFALLDVTKGRKKLEKHFEKRPCIGACPEPMRVPVVITGYIDSVYGRCDGESQEFTVTVTDLKVGTPGE